MSVSASRRTRHAFVLTLLCLCVAMLLIWIARGWYGNRLKQKIWLPKNEIGSLGPVVDHANLLLLMGDSRVAYWGGLKANGYTVQNVGMPGCTTAEVLLAVPEILKRTKPAIVLVQAGINDLKYLGVRPEMAPNVESLVVSNIVAIANLCRTAGARVIVTPIFPPGKVSPLRRLVWSSAIERGVERVNRQLLGLRLPDMGVIDLFNEAFENLSEAERFALYEDTLHLKKSAYNLLELVLQKHLEGVGRR